MIFAIIKCFVAFTTLKAFKAFIASARHSPIKLTL